MKIIKRDAMILLVGTRHEQWICSLDSRGAPLALRQGLENGTYSYQAVAEFLGDASPLEVKGAVEAIKALMT